MPNYNLNSTKKYKEHPSLTFQLILPSILTVVSLTTDLPRLLARQLKMPSSSVDILVIIKVLFWPRNIFPSKALNVISWWSLNQVTTGGGWPVTLHGSTNLLPLKTSSFNGKSSMSGSIGEDSQTAWESITTHCWFSSLHWKFLHGSAHSHSSQPVRLFIRPYWQVLLHDSNSGHWFAFFYC